MKVKDLTLILKEFSPISDVTIYNPFNPAKPCEVMRVEKTTRAFMSKGDSREIVLLKTF